VAEDPTLTASFQQLDITKENLLEGDILGDGYDEVESEEETTDTAVVMDEEPKEPACIVVGSIPFGLAYQRLRNVSTDLQ
jgi:hypothetical protein